MRKALYTSALVGLLLGGWLGAPASAQGPFSAQIQRALANVGFSGGTLVPSHGGTGIVTYAIGDLLYASAATTLSKLADVATGSVLISGGVATAPAWSNAPTLTVSALVATSTDSLVVENATAATVGVPAQISPRIRLRGNGWDTDDVVSRQVRFFEEALPSGTTTVTGTWKLGYMDPITSALTYPMTVSAAGGLTTLSFILAGGNIFAPATGSISFNGRTIMTSTQDGDFNLVASGGTSFGSVRLVGDIVFNGGAVAYGSGFGAGSPAPTGNASAFTITVGAGGDTTGVVTFSGVSFTNVPHCMANDRTTANLMKTTPTTAQVTVAGVMVAGDVLDVICLGHWQ